MHSRKLIALAVSLVINACVIALLVSRIHASAVRAAAAPVPTNAAVTLPIITVYPSAAEWRTLLHADTHRRS